MAFSRAVRKLICQTLAGVLLFAQMAVAAYACAGFADAAALKAMSAASAGSSQSAHCEQMDHSSKALCIEHCHGAPQSADTGAAPTLQAAMPPLLYALPVQPLWQPLRQPQGFAANLESAAAPPPPHAILHCVLRI